MAEYEQAGRGGLTNQHRQSMGGKPMKRDRPMVKPMMSKEHKQIQKKMK